ncbi:MAG TPA: MalY/PatB family protein [Bacillota bacterium]|nr:MalY/PatB family protein [Bacillota bacterium]
MLYDFDRITNRKNTGSVKWDSAPKFFSGEGQALLPLWVADMDFPAPQPVVDALVKRAQHGVFGYTMMSEGYRRAITGWMSRRHNWNVEENWIVTTPGVIPALHWLVRTFAQPGDNIVVQSPVYYHFYKAVRNTGCEIVYNPLQLQGDQYCMDFADLRQKITDRTKALILCNPHNPMGRVWTREELTALGELCLERGVLVISDEIHGDLIFPGHRHLPFASLSPEFAANSIICTSPSKTFNLAGLQTSNIIIPNLTLRRQFIQTVRMNGIYEPNLFGQVACEAAYNLCEDWLEHLLAYLEGNLQFLLDYVEANLPQVRVIKPQSTYLAWLDFRSLGLQPEELHQMLLAKARVWLDEGHIFGPGGGGFERINLACPRSVLQQALQNITEALR